MASRSEDDTFEVFVDDNYHYMDEGSRYPVGTFDSYEAALEKAKSIVDRSLRALLEPGADVDALMARYVMFGEDPFIRPAPEDVDRFSARDYARQRAEEIVNGRPPE